MHADRLRGIAQQRKVPRSLAEQLRRRHSWRREWGERRRYVPCWLASFVVHLTLIVTLGSLIVPQTDDPFLRPILLSFAESLAAKPASESPPAAVKLDAMALEEVAGRAANRSVENEPPASPPPASEPAAPVEPPAVPVVLHEPGAAPKADDPFATPLAVPQGDLNPDLKWLMDSARGAAGARVGNPVPAEPRQQELDEVVDRFIQYDIGRLTGTDGIIARRDFEALGPDSIPALVRGLNRSASIHASCPVCVITSKLQAALSQSKDRSLFAYAVANIGRDVPSNAPHRGRLMQLLNSLQKTADAQIALLESPDLEDRVQGLAQLVDQHGALSQEERVRAAEAVINLVEADATLRVAAHRVLAVMAAGTPGAPSEETLNENVDEAAAQWREYWRRIDTLEQLQRASYAVLAEALRSKDAVIRRGAAASIAAKLPRMQDGQKLYLARELIELMATDVESRPLFDKALMRLAGMSRNPGWQAEQWRAYWEKEDQEKWIGPRANSYLSMARRLEERGQVHEAIERYRKIVADFPSTPAATAARDRLTRLATR